MSDSDIRCLKHADRLLFPWRYWDDLSMW
jgi:hypothetical protein